MPRYATSPLDGRASDMSPLTELSDSVGSASTQRLPIPPSVRSSSPTPHPKPSAPAHARDTKQLYKRKSGQVSRSGKEHEQRTARQSAAHDDLVALRARAQALGVKITPQALANTRANVTAFLRANRSVIPEARITVASTESLPLQPARSSPRVSPLPIEVAFAASEGEQTTKSSSPSLPEDFNRSNTPETGETSLTLEREASDASTSQPSRSTLSFFTKVEALDLSIESASGSTSGVGASATGRGWLRSYRAKTQKQTPPTFDEVLAAAEHKNERERRIRKRKHEGTARTVVDGDHSGKPLQTRSESPVALLRRSTPCATPSTVRSSARLPSRPLSESFGLGARSKSDSAISPISGGGTSFEMDVEQVSTSSTRTATFSASPVRDPTPSAEPVDLEEISRHAWISPSGTLHLLPSPLPPVESEAAASRDAPSPSPYTAKVMRVRRRVNSAASSALGAEGPDANPPLMDSVMLDATGDVRTSISTFLKEEREEANKAMQLSAIAIAVATATAAERDEEGRHSTPVELAGDEIDKAPAVSREERDYIFCTPPIEDEEPPATQHIIAEATLQSPPRLGRSRRSRQRSARGRSIISLGSPVSAQNSKSVRWATDVASPTMAGAHYRLSTREHYEMLDDEGLDSPLSTVAEVAPLETIAVAARTGSSRRQQATMLGSSPLRDRANQLAQYSHERDGQDDYDTAEESLYDPQRGLLFVNSALEAAGDGAQAGPSVPTVAVNEPPVVHSSPTTHRGFGRFDMSPLKLPENPFGQTSSMRLVGAEERAARRVLSSPSALESIERQKLFLEHSPDARVSHIASVLKTKSKGSSTAGLAEKALWVGTASTVSPTALFGPASSRHPPSLELGVDRNVLASAERRQDAEVKLSRNVDDLRAKTKRKRKDSSASSMVPGEGAPTRTVAESSKSAQKATATSQASGSRAQAKQPSDWPSALEVPTVGELPRLAYVEESLQPGRKQPDGSRIVKLVSEELARALHDGKQAEEPPERFYTLPPGYGKSKERPPKAVSYAALIGQALKSSHDGRLGLAEIQAWIASVYACYTMDDRKWKDSIRHNLTVNHCFVNAEREPTCPGLGGWWSIGPEFRHCFLDDGTYNRGARPKDANGTSPVLKRKKKRGATEETLNRSSLEHGEEGGSSGNEGDVSMDVGPSNPKRFKVADIRRGSPVAHPEVSLRRVKSGKSSSKAYKGASDTDLSHSVGGYDEDDMVTPSRSQMVGYQSSGHGSRGRGRLPQLVNEGSSPPSSPPSSMPPPPRSIGLATYNPKSGHRLGDGSVGAGPVDSIALSRYGQSPSVHYATITMQRSPLAGMRATHGSRRHESPIRSSNRGSSARQRGGQSQKVKQGQTSPAALVPFRSPMSSVRAGAGADMERAGSFGSRDGESASLLRNSGHGRLASALGMLTSPGAGMGLSPLRRSHAMMASSPASSQVMSSPAGARLQVAVDMSTSGTPSTLQQHVPHLLAGPQWGLGMGMSPARLGGALTPGTLSRYASPSPMRRMGVSGAPFSPGPPGAGGSWDASGLDDPFDYSAALTHELDFTADMGGLTAGDLNASPARAARDYAYGYWAPLGAPNGAREGVQ